MPLLQPLSSPEAIEYSLLHHAKADGPVIGTYMDHPIAEAVIDESGKRFVYAGLAPRKRGGRLDVEALGPGEFILRPGLVYRCNLNIQSSRRPTPLRATLLRLLRAGPLPH
ncbi:MAG TPA: hypothetical protein VMA86_10130 [Acetobacteraceae bacterium]|nr:hypothetical protein [Acetobacteraceae bacterium]